MSEMVERIGRAIYEARNGRGCKPWGNLPKQHQEPYRSDARAALAAMPDGPKPSLQTALKPFADAWAVATHHKDVVARLTMAQLGELAAREVSGVHFRNAFTAVSTPAHQPEGSER